MEPKMLVCEHVKKTYGKKEVLTDVNLQLEPGKIYGLIGRNGIGKTTLLSLMTAQAALTDGSVTYGGEKVWENEKVLNEMCFSHELPGGNTSPVAAYKVKDYLKMASHYLKYWDKDYAARLVEIFKLNEKQKCSKMSKGQLSALTIVAALASRAPVTFLDEPVAGLDVVMRDKFYELLLDDYAETGRTFVLSTHIIEEAADLLEEVIILHDGVVKEKINTQELIGQFRYVSGKAEQLQVLAAQFSCLHEEGIGSMQTLCLRSADGSIEAAAVGMDVDIRRVPLAKIFVYLTGEEKEGA